MFRRTWQASMILLARSSWMKNFMQTSRAGSTLARRYVAGADAAAGLEFAAALFSRRQIRSSFFYLGEYVSSPDAVAENVAQKLEIAALLGSSALDVHVSVDPTQVGYMLSPAQADKHVGEIAHAIARAVGGRPGVHALMLDMEDQSVTDDTIALHDRLQDEALPVALTLQAYLRRTEGDLLRQIERGARVRLVKGAFAAGAAVAYVSQDAIKANYRRLISFMLSHKAKDTGFYPVIATHDTRLHDYAISCAIENGWLPEQWEFEMLLGVRGDVAHALAARGYRVRLYVPFGRDWWPHAVRRIGENPRNALLLTRSLLPHLTKR
jgi:proline dehydrogenase